MISIIQYTYIVKKFALINSFYFAKLRHVTVNYPTRNNRWTRETPKKEGREYGNRGNGRQ